MKAVDILKLKPRILSQADRESYFRDGFLCVKEIVPVDVLARLQQVTAGFQEQSRLVRQSDDRFDVSPEHSSSSPVLRRLKSPDIQHKAYWDFTCGLMADVAAELLGPDVVFHHSKLNFKWFDTTDTVKWHQDIQFYPHTNYNVLTIGCYLVDTDMSNGPLAALQGSHNEKLYDQYDEDGNWTGMLSDSDAAGLDDSRVKYMTGKAGTITIHNARTLHYSPASKNSVPRPLLLNAYTSADAKPYTAHSSPTENTYKIVRGEQAVWAEHDSRPCQLPPDWAGTYSSIYAAQSGENKSD